MGISGVDLSDVVTKQTSGMKKRKLSTYDSLRFLTIGRALIMVASPAQSGLQFLP